MPGGGGDGDAGGWRARLGRLVKNRPVEQMVAYPPTSGWCTSPQERRLLRTARKGAQRGGRHEMGGREGVVGDRESSARGVAQITQMRNDHQAIGGGLRCRRYSCSGFCGICARRGYIYTCARTQIHPHRRRTSEGGTEGEGE